MKVCSAFTLIELLIVVAIISVLAAIAVPNFLEAQIRAKVARVRADQRSMATAIEAYAVDTNKYPIRRDSWWLSESIWWAPPFNAKIYDPLLPTAAVGLHVITTPVSYISAVPKDVFNTPAVAMAQPGNPYSDVIDYWDAHQCDKWWSFMNAQKFKPGIMKGWMLISVGPDLRIGLSNGNPGGYPPDTVSTQFSSRSIYDPSNGTVSAGNVYRFSGASGQADLLL